MKGSKRVCKNGHTYFKSSDCPVCPICENQKETTIDFYKGLSAPAKRALESAGIRSLKKLSSFSVETILKLHGLGPSSIPKLEAALQQAGLKFKKSENRGENR